MGRTLDEARAAKKEALQILAIFLICWAIGIGFYHLVEKLSLLDAFYFASMTLTTVGYGDFAPVTTAGKLFTTFYAFIGVGIFFGFANVVLRGTLSRMVRPHFTPQLKLQAHALHDKLSHRHDEDLPTSPSKS